MKNIFLIFRAFSSFVKQMPG